MQSAGGIRAVLPRQGLLLLVALVLAAGQSRGQLYQFGKNKVQYVQFDWQKMQTPHFDLFFYPAEEGLAAHAAQIAEQRFRDLEIKSGHTVQRRIPLIVYSSPLYFEQTNIIPNLLPEEVGGFTEFLKGRVVLPFSGSLPEFERVLHHELVHVFTFDLIRQVHKRYGIMDYRPVPLWLSEGLAEYWSSDWDRYGDMVIRDALFAGQLVPIAQMYRLYGTFQLYKEGQSICQFMASTFGEDVFERLLANWWRSRDFDQTFQLVTGKTLAELDEEWQYHLRKTYLPGIAGADPPSRIARALTSSGFNLKPEIVFTAGGHPDSSSFVFFRNHQGYTHIARTRLAGGEPVAVVAGERSSAFESLHPLSTKLAVSADGRWLAFAAKRRGRDHLYLWDLEKGRERQHFSFDSLVAISSPSWSPDSQALVFAGAEESGSTDLYVVEVAEGRLRRLTADIYHDRDPDWSPDGGSIVFSSDRWPGGRQGFYNLFLCQVDSGRIQPLSRGSHNDLHPAWSPDGTRVVFSSDRDTMFNLYTLQWTADSLGERKQTGIRRLTHILTGAFDPVWLPGGKGVLFTGFEAAGFHIYRLDLPAAADTSQVSLVSLPADSGGTWGLEKGHGPALFTRQQYRKRMTLDIAQSQVSQDPELGTAGGIQVGLSDMLGNDYYYFILSHLSGEASGFWDGFNLAMARIHLARQVKIHWGIFRLNDRLGSQFGRFVREKRTGGYVELGYPFSVFDRLEVRLSLRHADIDRRFEDRRLKGWLAANYLSYTYDTSLWIPTGPLEGTRYSLGIGQTIDFKGSRRFNATFFGDYRHYFRLSRRSCLAVRLMGRHSRGEWPEFFSLGGSWTLRGYPWSSIWGNSLLLANHELRFPLLDRLVLAFPFGNVDLGPFRGALFADAGNAWSGQFGEWKGSLGAGVRLSLGGVFVFRLDGARRTNFKSVGNDTHWDFFFGWDF